VKCFQVGPARFRAPEVLFRPDLIGEESEGLHEVLLYSIQKSDLDLRQVLYQNIVLSGGSTLFKVIFIKQQVYYV
jgi:centractin